MPRRDVPLLPYTKRNLARVTKAIIRHLSADLLPIKYREKNATNPMFGHCHTASGCLYKVFGSENLQMYRSLDKNGIYHWWVQDKDDEIIDITASQYPNTVVQRLYKSGEKAGMLGFKYKQNVKVVLSKVCNELGIDNHHSTLLITRKKKEY